jgi:hypothetical protein
VKTPAILRLASALALLQFLAHTWLFVTATPRHGPAEAAVIAAMKGHSFEFRSAVRSYWDFYYGYGLFAAFTVFVEAVLLWQLAGLAAHDPARARPMAALFAFANLGYAALCLRYFFITPVVPDVVIALCLVWAVVAAGSRRSA